MASRSRSPSEGEILESSSSEEKATKSQSGIKSNAVDRPSRKPERRDNLSRRSSFSRSRSPYRSPRPDTSSRYQSRSRSRSPYRAPRGEKRPSSNDHYGRDGGSRRDRERDNDSRSFRVHFEDRQYNGSDHSRGAHRGGRGRGEDRRSRNDDHHRGKRPRRESHSAGRDDSRREISSRKDHPSNSADSKHDSARLRPDSARDFAHEYLASRRSRHENGVAASNVGSVDSSQADGPAEPDSHPLDEAALIEQRRKRREAIKAKHSTQPSPMLVQALSLQSEASPASIPAVGVDSESNTPLLNSRSLLTAGDVLQVASPQAAQSTPREGSPAVPLVSNDADLANQPRTPNADQEDGPSAADYDPTVDMQEDNLRAEHQNHEDDMSAAAYDETQNTKQEVLIPHEPQPRPAADSSFDMFGEAEEDDMFAEARDPTHQAANKNHAQPASKSKALDMSMLDDFDDHEGYYKTNLGELLDNRYQVQLNLGRGMFSAVVRALDSVTHKAVAIKIIRRNETMRKAALKEIDILALLNSADPDDKKHVIRLERHFEHKGHICMVFESLSINLREVLKKFGRDVGINLQAVRAYAHQLFLSLSLLRKCNILHADLKPDNILVSESRNLLKLCDLGSASDAGDVAADSTPTPYLVSRFYRAPELILGMPATSAIDVWSTGCTLFELYTGKILFAGRSNNQMLRAIMECRGRFPPKALRKASLAHLHFDDQGNFRSVERDKAGGRDVARVLNLARPVRDLRLRLAAAGGRADDAAEIALFLDLLDKCLALNPERRCTPADALRHPFISRPK